MAVVAAAAAHQREGEPLKRFEPEWALLGMRNGFLRGRFFLH